MRVTVHRVTGGLVRDTPAVATGTGSDTILVAQIAETTSESGRIPRQLPERSSKKMKINRVL